MINPNVYEPREDTYFLIKLLEEELKNKKNSLEICEVGVGSGEIISKLEKEYPNNYFFGTDINPDAIKLTKNRTPNSEIKKGNFLEPFNKKFDIIYFNTPYLPCEENESYENLSIKDKAIYGGKHGYEIIEKFILEINDKLNNNGHVYMLFSNLSQKGYIDNLLSLLCFEFKCIAKKEVGGFEELYIYKIKKSSLLQQLCTKGISKLKYLDSGKHSKVLEGIYGTNEVIIKIGKEQHLSKESLFMKKLKDEEFMPKFYFDLKGCVVREKLNGKQIRYWLENAKKKDIVIVLNKVFEFCNRLDKLGINKFEMTNPYKHIFIDKNLNCKMIDYERCIYTNDPKNTTQFLQYVKRNINFFKTKELGFDENKILEMGRNYKAKKVKININLILK